MVRIVGWEELYKQYARLPLFPRRAVKCLAPVQDAEEIKGKHRRSEKYSSSKEKKKKEIKSTRRGFDQS